MQPRLQTTLRYTQKAGNPDGGDPPEPSRSPSSVLSSSGTLGAPPPPSRVRAIDPGGPRVLLPRRRSPGTPAPRLTSRGGAEERAARGGAVVPGRELHAVAEGYAASGDGPAGSLAAAAAPRHVSSVPPTTLQQPRDTSAQPFSCPARPFRLGSTPPEPCGPPGPTQLRPAACKWFPVADLDRFCLLQCGKSPVLVPWVAGSLPEALGRTI